MQPRQDAPGPATIARSAEIDVVELVLQVVPRLKVQRGVSHAVQVQVTREASVQAVSTVAPPHAATVDAGVQERDRRVAAERDCAAAGWQLDVVGGVRAHGTQEWHVARSGSGFREVKPAAGVGIAPVSYRGVLEQVGNCKVGEQAIQVWRDRALSQEGRKQALAARAAGEERGQRVPTTGPVGHIALEEVRGLVVAENVGPLTRPRCQLYVGVGGKALRQCAFVTRHAHRQLGRALVHPALLVGAMGEMGHVLKLVGNGRIEDSLPRFE